MNTNNIYNQAVALITSKEKWDNLTPEQKIIALHTSTGWVNPPPAGKEYPVYTYEEALRLSVKKEWRKLSIEQQAGVSRAIDKKIGESLGVSSPKIYYVNFEQYIERRKRAAAIENNLDINSINVPKESIGYLGVQSPYIPYKVWEKYLPDKSLDSLLGNLKFRLDNDGRFHHNLRDTFKDPMANDYFLHNGSYQLATDEVLIHTHHGRPKSPEKVIELILHEGSGGHVYQFKAMKGEIEHKDKAELETWKENVDNYIPSADSYGKYRSQVLESDAKWFAKKALPLVLADRREVLAGRPPKSDFSQIRATKEPAALKTGELDGAQLTGKAIASRADRQKAMSNRPNVQSVMNGLKGTKIVRVASRAISGITKKR